MKNSPMPPRKGPLPRGKGFQRRGALERQAERTRQAVKSKPRSVTPEERRARKLVRERSGGVCEVQIVCHGARATNWHHRVNQGQGGAWDPVNGLAVCGSGTTGCHGWITQHPALSKAPERGWSVQSTRDPATVPVLVAGRGLVYLDASGGVTSATEGEAA